MCGAAASLLEPRRPSDPRRLRGFLIRQVELYEMATELPNILPEAHRTARFMAALSQIELGHRLQPPDALARQACLRNLRCFLNGQQSTPLQSGACFNMAFELGEYDSARAFMVIREGLVPEEPAVRRDRIRLEIASGAYAEALRRIQALLARDDRDPWALDQERKVREQIKALVRTSESSAPQ